MATRSNSIPKLLENFGVEVIQGLCNAVTDYTGHLVSDEVGLTRLNNSVTAVYAEDKEGKRHGTKAHRLTTVNCSPALSGIRNLIDRLFNFPEAVATSLRQHPDSPDCYA